VKPGLRGIGESGRMVRQSAKVLQREFDSEIDTRRPRIRQPSTIVSRIERKTFFQRRSFFNWSYRCVDIAISHSDEKLINLRR
jgi:hypothetical protein